MLAFAIIVVGLTTSHLIDDEFTGPEGQRSKSSHGHATF